MNALEPAGPQAAHIAELWNITIVLCSVVFALILVAFFYALWWASRREPATQPQAWAGEESPWTRRSILWATMLSAVLLSALIVVSIYTDRALANMPLAGAVHVQATAHQWWWEMRYDDPDPSRIFTTANELHIPVGRPVILTLKSSDVIHSFWIPSLAGKKDMIPGRTSTIRLRADRAGEYRGLCAEFCGYQHANMSFLVTAEPQPQFDAWLEAQRQPAAEPTETQTVRGKKVFLTSPCAMCHAIQGTTAQAVTGPDLTHVASRKYLAAGRLPNNSGNLMQWIVDPNHVKPGVSMPPTALPAEDLRALVAYLGSLK